MSTAPQSLRRASWREGRLTGAQEPSVPALDNRESEVRRPHDVDLDHPMVVLTTGELLLWVPTLVYATTEKYQVPGERFGTT